MATIVCLLAVAIVGPSGASAESLCTDTWTGPSEGAWQTASNWSGEHAPSSTDVACIGEGKTARVAEGVNGAGVVQGRGAVNITGGSLELANAMEASSISTFTQTAGTLLGAATLEVSGSFVWGGGTMSGSGKTVLGSSVSGRAYGVLLAGRAMVNEGLLTVEGHVAMANGAQLQNIGTLKDNLEGPPGNVSIEVASESVAAPSIVNVGTFEKTESEPGGTHETIVAVPVENRSVVSASGGVLTLSGGGSSSASGKWNASEGAEIEFGGGSFAITGGVWSGKVDIRTAAVTAEGVDTHTSRVILKSGSLNVPAGAITVLSLLMEGGGTGTLTGGGTVTVTQAFQFTGGAMSGTGLTVLGVNSTGHIGNGTLLTERTLTNEGTEIVEGSAFVMSEGAHLLNMGTVIANHETYPNTPAIEVGATSRLKPLIVNVGTFEKTETENETEHVTLVAVPFENLGIVANRVPSGIGSLAFSYPVFAEPSTQWGCDENPSAPDREVIESSEGVCGATGSFSETQTDLSVGGRGVGLDLSRTYNSQEAATGARGAFGSGWSSSFSDHLVLEPAAKRATLVQAAGATVPFAETGGGGFTAPSSTQDVLSGTEGSGFTLTLKDQTVYRFAGSSGRLESVTDRNGNATTLAYNPGGNLETITDPSGRTITLAYNSEGLVESATDPMKHVVKYTYEGGNLATVSQPSEASLRWQFKYDGSHQLTERTDGRGGKTTYEYNGSHQVTAQTDPMKRTTTFEYKPFENRTINQATGAVTVQYYTSLGLPAAITHGFGTASATTESFSYDAAGNRLRVTDGNGHTAKYSYDTHSNRISMVDPAEHETKWTYNTTHDVETTTTPKGETTTYRRDAHGNPETIERPAPGGKTQTTKYKYDTHGNVESMEDPLKRTWKYEYDSAGDRTAETDPEGDKRTWGYNENSQETSTVSPRGHVKAGEEAKYTTKTERDAQGRAIKITDPLLHETRSKYDGNGNLEVKTDPELHETIYSYDADNEQTKIKEPNGTVTETGYDGAGKVTSQTDGNKHETKYIRNVLEQVTEVIDPLGRRTTKEYDAAGNLKALTDPSKRTATYAYDAANRLKEVSYSDGKTPAVKYEYDADGNRKSMTDGTGETSYIYDQLDRLTEGKDGHGDKTSYEYDLANEKTKITYPNTKSVSREYDNAGRLKSVTDWAEHTTKFGYDADADLKATTYPTGTSNVDTYAYDETDAMKEVKMAKGAKTLASLVYTRNIDGQVKGATSKGLPGETSPAYTYDTNSRLSKGAAVTYNYDAANDPTTIGSGTYKYDAAKELETGPSLTYTYDELGQRTKTKPTTTGPATTYGYDQAGNMTSVERPKGGETAEIKDTYAYNGDRLRTAQTISATTTYMVWEEGVSLPLLLNDGTNSYIYGPGGLPVEQVSGSGAVTYLHHDQQGSTRLLTGSTGTVTGSTTFDAYGDKTGSTGASATPMGYDGQYTDQDTGLIYLRARYYDPATAQFTSIDPEAQHTLALYTYGSGDPLAFGDPTGMCAIASAAGFKSSWSPEQCEQLYSQIKRQFHELERRLRQLKENTRKYDITTVRKYVKTYQDKRTALQDSLRQYNLHGCPSETSLLIPEKVYELLEVEVKVHIIVRPSV